MAYISQRAAQHLWVDAKECGDTTSCGLSVIIVYVEIFTNLPHAFIGKACYFLVNGEFGMQAVTRDTKQGLVP